MPSSLPEKFKKSLSVNLLILPGEKIFVACSGGPDSTALLHLLESVRTPLKLRLGLIHFNHGLRPQAAKKDELFVRRLAKRLKVPFYGGSGNVKRLAKKEKYSLEEAARFSRYEFFKKVAARHRISKIATAHTLNDQAETILMRVLQGTGLRGLCGIRSSLRQGNLVFVRPLLDFSKKEILQYLRENHLRFCTDSSNASEKYLRNRIRRKLIPWLVKDFHPKAMEAIARIPAILSQDAKLLETAEAKSWERIFLSQAKGKVFLSRTRFLKSEPSLQFRLLDRSLRMLDSKSGLSFEAWQSLRLFLSRPHARHSLPKDIDFVLTPSKLVLYKK